jgi:hypothetical protein
LTCSAFAAGVEDGSGIAPPEAWVCSADMTIGTSILLIAVGAILKYAVTADVSGIDLQTVGVILMLVGILGLILSLLYTFVFSDKARARGAAGPGDYEAPTRNIPRDRL